jgi:hypothetical protein
VAAFTFLAPVKNLFRGTAKTYAGSRCVVFFARALVGAGGQIVGQQGYSSGTLFHVFFVPSREAEFTSAGFNQNSAIFS